MNNIRTDNKTKSETSNTTLWKFFVVYSFLMIATDIIPPASAATKYASISGMPWMRYLSTLNDPT